ncbi:MAG: DNA recombination protein RmuC [Prolixibacteraceae bacterium]
MDWIMQVFIPILVGSVVYFYFNNKTAHLKNQHLAAQNELQQNWQDKYSTLEKILSVENERLFQSKNAVDKLSEELKQLGAQKEVLANQSTRQNAENKYLSEKLELQAKEFERLQKQASIEFENLAGRILKKNTEDFSTSNHKKMDDLISPLRERILSFEKQVVETYEKGLKDQSDLKAELKKLYDLNHRISDEANNLTRALKGDVKQQGNWGEIVLERILERSGLTEGQEFDREVVAQNAEGKTIRPDVIVNLPDKKHIIIDSKVSLVAYERYTNCENIAEKSTHLKNHLDSLKAHVKGLNAKHYSSSMQFNSPDFVLLFMPIESSFSLAVEQDQQLFNFAWDNKVVMVSPSTLLATLRTIASIWQQENQTKNAIEIARQGGALYDKFVGFIGDLDKIGKNIDSLQKTYDDASNKLSTGKGNLVSRVERIKELGAATSKKLPEKYEEEK